MTHINRASGLHHILVAASSLLKTSLKRSRESSIVRTLRTLKCSNSTISESLNGVPFCSWSTNKFDHTKFQTHFEGVALEQIVHVLLSRA